MPIALLRDVGRAAKALLFAGLLVPGTASAQQPSPPAAGDSTLDLAKKTQNPIADLISLPLQNNLNFGYGAKDAPKPDGDDTWTVPLGGGGRLIRIGKLPVNLQAQAYYNVVKPDDAATADWTLCLQVQFLFPK